MRRYITTFTAAALAVVSVAAIAFPVSNSGAGATGNPTLTIKVGATNCVSVGQGTEIGVSIDISSVSALTAWEATVVYDPAVLELVAHDARLFLSKDGGFVLDASEQPPYDGNGRHFLSAGLVGPAVGGGGALGTLTFKAISTGISAIAIPQRDLNGDGKADEGASLQNAGTFIGDVNGDGFFDGPVISAAIAVGQPCGPVPTTSPTHPPTPGPTATPAPTASPTAQPSVAPTPTGATGTGTPTPTPSGGSPGTATPAATATSSPVPGAELVWGDANCTGAADSVDSLLTLRHDAGLSTVTNACPHLGQQLNTAAVHTWGDVDCSGDVGVVDALKLLRFDAGLSLATATGCPPLGSQVTIAPQPV